MLKEHWSLILVTSHVKPLPLTWWYLGPWLPSRHIDQRYPKKTMTMRHHVTTTTHTPLDMSPPDHHHHQQPPPPPTTTTSTSTQQHASQGVPPPPNDVDDHQGWQMTNGEQGLKTICVLGPQVCFIIIIYFFIYCVYLLLDYVYTAPYNEKHKKWLTDVSTPTPTPFTHQHASQGVTLPPNDHLMMSPMDDKWQTVNRDSRWFVSQVPRYFLI